MRPVCICGKWIDLDRFIEHIRVLGQKYKDNGNPVGQRLIEKAPEIAEWYVKHQSMMRGNGNTLRQILEKQESLNPYDSGREHRDFLKRQSRAAACPNGFFPEKRMCGNAKNCDPQVCRGNRERVALSTKGDT